MTPLLDKLFTLEAVSFIAVPLGVLVLNYLLQQNFKASMSGAGDVFAFAAAVDISYLVNQRSVTVINPLFKQQFVSVCTVFMLASLILMAYSARVQGQLHQYSTSRRVRYYPAFGVAICWTFALTIIGFHLFLIFGG